MSNIIISIKKVKPRHEACEVCHQVVDKSEVLFSDKIKFAGDELDLSQQQFIALKQIILNASAGFIKALMENDVKAITQGQVTDATKPTIPEGAGNSPGFAIVPPAKEPPTND